MTLPEPDDIIAPRDDRPYDATDYISELFMGAYSTGAVLQYHDLLLYSQTTGDGPGVWDVYTADEEYIETLHLGGFRTVSEVLELLDEIRLHDPSDRDEWVDR